MFEKAESMLNGRSSNAKRICAQIQDCLTSVKNCCRLIVIATTSMLHLIDTSFKQGSRFSYEVIFVLIGHIIGLFKIHFIILHFFLDLYWCSIRKRTSKINTRFLWNFKHKYSI